MAVSIKDFFCKTYENKINELMFDKRYIFPKTEVIEYICDICNFDFKDVIDYIYNLKDLDPISSENIFQFSSFDDCSINICKKIENNEDPGYRFKELGILLCGDGKTDMANRKYGENASKTAKELGFCQIIDNYVFLSCIGKVFPELSEMRRNKLICLLILRSNYFSSLLHIANGKNVDACCLMGALSEKTILRRKSNIKKLILILKSFNDDSLNDILCHINY